MSLSLKKTQISRDFS